MPLYTNAQGAPVMYMNQVKVMCEQSLHVGAIICLSIYLLHTHIEKWCTDES